MFKLIITTEYNVIELYEDEFEKEQLKEILMQPYIINVEKVWVEKKTKVRRKNNEKRG